MERENTLTIIYIKIKYIIIIMRNILQYNNYIITIFGGGCGGISGGYPRCHPTVNEGGSLSETQQDWLGVGVWVCVVIVVEYNIVR